MNTTHTSSQEHCGCSCCETPVSCRPRYFPRQLITPDDLSLEADYFRDALRRMRRMLWGYGVVCGAVVCRAPKCDPQLPAKKEDCDPKSQRQTASQSSSSAAPEREWEPWTVIIKPGYILGPCGDEIIIPCEHRWDFRKRGATRTSGDPCPEPCDPWCTETGRHHEDRTFCIAIKYKQIMTRPVRVQPVGCGCEDAPCEYSRWCDGYELNLLSDCDCFREEPPCEESTTSETAGEKVYPGPRLESFLCTGVPPCPPCPESPWLCLAQIKFDHCGHITHLGNCDCRRLAISFSNFWRKCKHDDCCDVPHVTAGEDKPQSQRTHVPSSPGPAQPSPALTEKDRKVKARRTPH